MILSVNRDGNLGGVLNRIGIETALAGSGSVLIKINLARPPEPGHPRTAVTLFAGIIEYFGSKNVEYALAERMAFCMKFGTCGVGEIDAGASG